MSYYKRTNRRCMYRVFSYVATKSCYNFNVVVSLFFAHLYYKRCHRPVVVIAIDLHTSLRNVFVQLPLLIINYVIIYFR